MRVYRERLGVPASWWLGAAACVVLFGTMLWAGLSLLMAAAVYAALGTSTAALLVAWGTATIEVTGSGVRAGRELLPLGQIGEVAVMDAAQTRALRGPRSNPAAYLLIRPYLPKSVYIEVTGSPGQAPYWLIGTRRPADLAAAIGQARSRAGSGAPLEGAPWEDALSEQPPAAGAAHAAGAHPAGADHHRRESDAR